MTTLARARAHVRFEKWIEAMGWNNTAAAYHLGCDSSYVRNLRIGRSGDRIFTPGRRIANAIARLSCDWDEGPISASEWDEAEDELKATGS